MRFKSVRKEDPKQYRKLILKIKFEDGRTEIYKGMFIDPYYIIEGYVLKENYKVVGWKYDEG